MKTADVEAVVRRNQDKFLCIDEKDTRLYGTFDSNRGRVMNIYVRKCKGDGCRSVEESNEYFKGKYLLML